jgi:porin
MNCPARIWSVLSALVSMHLLALPASAGDGNPPFGVEIHGIVQHGVYSDAVSGEGGSISDRTRGAAIADLVFDYPLSAQTHLGGLVRWAQGNALNNTGGLTLVPYGGDVEDNVRNINGHSRDYLLEAWLAHAIDLEQDTRLELTAGLVDASNYIDQNAFANDEFSQFMNAAFILNNLAGIPAYDPGVALGLRTERWSLSAITMRTRDEEAGSYSYYATEVGFNSRQAMGEGNYRIFAFSTTADFRDPNKGRNKALRGGGVSMDQYLNEWLGVFARFGYQSHVAPDYEHLYSAGLHLDGSLWNRAADSAGIAVARLDGEDHSALGHTNVLELYTRFVFTERIDLSFDIQYMKDQREGADQDPRVLVLGTRLNLAF